MCFKRDFFKGGVQKQRKEPVRTCFHSMDARNVSMQLKHKPLLRQGKRLTMTSHFEQSSSLPASAGLPIRADWWLAE